MKRALIKIAAKASTLINDITGSPAIETAAIIVFVGLLVISKAGGVGEAIGGAFDAVIDGITDGLAVSGS